MHIDNLYKNQTILLLKECYASEKIHGTSAHIKWNGEMVTFFSGGVDHVSFCNLFDAELLRSQFLKIGYNDVTVYGEAYGGKCQGMRDTYGPDLKFIVFDVNIGGSWLNVPDAEDITHILCLEFVHYERIPATMEAIDAQRDSPSVQAVRNGMATADNPKIREGVVLRPIIEVIQKNGERVIAKHKRDEFRETNSPRVPTEKLQVMIDAERAADEWVTQNRLQHVLDSMQEISGRCQEFGVEDTGDVIRAMLQDVYREGEGEIIKSHDLNKAIGKRTALLFKQYIARGIHENMG
jgi:hypothetical protein